MNVNGLLSNRTLRLLGVVMGLVGLADVAIELHLSVRGFGPFICVIAVYYMHHSRSKNNTTPSNKDNTYIYRRLALIFLGLAIIELCLLEMATRFSVFGSMEMLGYVGGLVFVFTFCLAALCFTVVAFRYIMKLFSSW